MKLYLVRHGQTQSNKLSLHQGEDENLSGLGLKQAEVLAERFSRIAVELVYSSPYPRAKDTAQAIVKKIKKRIIYTDLLKERKNPSQIIGQRRHSTKVKKIRNLIEKNSCNPFWHYSDEENFFEFRERIEKFFTLAEKSRKENVLAVTHTNPIILVTALAILKNELSPDAFSQFRKSVKLDNTGITLLERDKDGQWLLRIFNDHSHLG